MSHLPNLCLNVGRVIVLGVGPNEVNRIVVKVLGSANTAVLAFTLLGYTGRVNFGSLFVRHLGPLHKCSLVSMDHNRVASQTGNFDLEERHAFGNIQLKYYGIMMIMINKY